MFVARSCLDVFRSQNRRFGAPASSGSAVSAAAAPLPTNPGWTCEHGRKEEWQKYYTSSELRPHFDPADMICAIKQHAWLRYQEDALRRREIETLTLDYESLQTHPLWLEPRVRANFTSSKQTAQARRRRRR